MGWAGEGTVIDLKIDGLNDMLKELGELQKYNLNFLIYFKNKKKKKY